MTEQILITGSNRGIGFAFVKEYMRHDVHIFASCRSPETAATLLQLKDDYPNKITLIPLEVTDEKQIASAFDAIKNKTEKLDLLINNAAILSDNDNYGSLKLNQLNEIFKVNVSAPVYISQQFVPLLEKSNAGKIINISSKMGSIELTSGGAISYSATKSAINMISKSISISLRSKGIISISLDPGWNRTDMGGKSAILDPNESAQQMIDLINNLTIQNSGKYYRYSGEELPW